jgi:penicillin-binding protein 1A
VPSLWALMRTLSRTLLTFVLTIVVGGIAVGACLAALIPGTVEIATGHHYTADQVAKLSALAQPTTIYWGNGITPMATLGLQARQPISDLKEVPDRVINAVIATEDRSFWTNDGIDLGAVVRAFLTNVTSGKIEQGGSTITQQLVKNRLLTSKRDVNRKIKEIEDAYRLNQKFSKQKILVEYLNTVYFGSGSYGIKAAASRFFLTLDPGTIFPRGKRLDELTIGEAALLAGVISNPEGDNPFTHPDRAIRRRADVLRGEVESGYITQAEADAANNEPLPKDPPPAEQRPRSYLVAEVQDRLLADPRLGSTAKERRDKVLKGGLRVYTTFDPTLQNLAVAATTNAKPQKGPDWISSLVAIDPSTGAVRAMVGGPDFADSQYNIATHPVGRQPGSTWKVIALAAALENGYSPNDQIDGSAPCSVPSVFGTASTTNAEGGGGGVSDLRDATAESINCAFVRLATSVGQDKLIALAHKMGIVQNTLQKILTLPIGTIEETPLEMATVMATVASGGIHHTPYVVQKVVGPDGRILIDETGAGDRVLDADVAACEQNVLRDVVVGPEAHTGGNANLDSHTAYGKTGTTDRRADAWFIGATPQLATAVWFGNRTGTVEGAGFGGDSSAPIFKAFMDAALAGQPDIPLPDPGPVCAREGETVNPDGGRDPNSALVNPGPVTPPQIQQIPTPSPTVQTTPRPTVPTVPGKTP